MIANHVFADDARCDRRFFVVPQKASKRGISLGSIEPALRTIDVIPNAAVAIREQLREQRYRLLCVSSKAHSAYGRCANVVVRVRGLRDKCLNDTRIAPCLQLDVLIDEDPQYSAPVLRSEAMPFAQEPRTELGGAPIHEHGEDIRAIAGMALCVSQKAVYFGVARNRAIALDLAEQLVEQTWRSPAVVTPRIQFV